VAVVGIPHCGHNLFVHVVENRLEDIDRLHRRILLVQQLGLHTRDPVHERLLLGLGAAALADLFYDAAGVDVRVLAGDVLLRELLGVERRVLEGLAGIWGAGQAWVGVDGRRLRHGGWRRHERRTTVQATSDDGTVARLRSRRLTFSQVLEDCLQVAAVLGVELHERGGIVAAHGAWVAVSRVAVRLRCLTLRLRIDSEGTKVAMM